MYPSVDPLVQLSNSAPPSVSSCAAPSALSAAELASLPVDVMVTYRCNLRCRKCYAPKTGFEAPIDAIRSAIDKLSDAGIRRLILTGGEPLVRDDIVEIAAYARMRRMDVCLSTNGMLLRQKWAAIAPYLSWVSISLDAPSAELDNTLTGGGGGAHFAAVLEFLRHRNDYAAASPRVKLGTVITRRNIGSLVDLGHVIFRDFSLYMPDAWRLYQFSTFTQSSALSERATDGLAVTDEEAGDIADVLRSVFPQANVSYLNACDRDEAYVFILPSLEVAYPRRGSYVRIGDIRTMQPSQVSDVLASIRRIAKRAIHARQMYEHIDIRA